MGLPCLHLLQLSKGKRRSTYRRKYLIFILFTQALRCTQCLTSRRKVSPGVSRLEEKLKHCAASKEGTFVYNTPLRSQSRQLTDIISIQISRPDLLSIQITFQIPNYFPNSKLLSNYFQINFKLLSQITFKLLMRLGMNMQCRGINRKVVSQLT